MEIRGDIYPDFQGPDRRTILEKQTHLISAAFQSFRSQGEVIEYLNSLSSPKIAELFLETGTFYFSARFHYCPYCGKRFDVCPNKECNESFKMPAHVVSTMMISIMEKLSRGLGDYRDFFDWINEKNIAKKYQARLKSREIETYKELAESLRDEYRDEYGSSTKITEFFKRFLDKDEKIDFIRSIRYPKRAPDLPPRLPDIKRLTKENLGKYFQEIEKERYILFKSDEDIRKYVQRKSLKSIHHPLPDCFDEEHYWKCYSRDLNGQGYGYCHYSLFAGHCRLLQDEALLDAYFRKAVQTFYDWRSEFVHDARLPPIREITDIVLDFYKRKKKHVIVEINIKKLRPTFENMFRRYFDAYKVKDK